MLGHSRSWARLVDEEHAALAGAARPLVRAAGVEVRLHVREVDVEQAEALRAIDERQDAALARDPAQLLRRHQVADRAREMREGQDLGARRHGAREGLDVVLHARVRVLLFDGHHREAEALALLAPGGQVARVVVRMDDHLVARLEVETVRHQVVRLAGVARDDDLVGRHAQELGQRLARVLLLRHQAGRGCSATGRGRRSRSRAGSVSSTGREAGQRFAAFMTARSGGITNCSRTLFQNASPAAAPPGASARDGRAPAAPTPGREERRRAAEGKEPREVSSRD